MNKTEQLAGLPAYADSRLANDPPLRAVRAFEAIARLGSVTLAAQELDISPSAVSHQLKVLEGYLQMPLNHLGYVVDYADVNQPLPSAIYPDRYAGVITWFSGFYPGSRGRMVEQWLGQRMDLGLPLAIVGTWGKEPGAAFARKLGLQNAAEPAADRKSVV